MLVMRTPPGNYISCASTMLYTGCGPSPSPHPNMRRRFFLIANPAAGVAGAPLVEDVVRALERQGASLTRTIAADIVAVRRAARMAADSGTYDAVIAAG